MPSPTSLLAIFETFLEGHLRQEKQGKRFQQGVVQVCASLIKGALSVHQEVGVRQRSRRGRACCEKEALINTNHYQNNGTFGC